MLRWSLSLLQPLGIVTILSIPFALAFGLPKPESGEPITRVARMTSDLNQSLVGTAIVDRDGEEVQVHADATFPKSLRGRQVLVFYSGLFREWRLLDTDISVLSPRT